MIKACTKNHLILTENRGWVEAGKLNNQDKIVTTMKKLTKTEFNRIYKTHQLFLQSNETNGKCANFSGIDLRNLNSIVDSGRILNLPNADFSDANLYGVNLCNANLRNANFEKAYLKDADFTQADIHGAIFTNAIVSETKFIKCCCAEDVLQVAANFSEAILKEDEEDEEEKDDEEQVKENKMNKKINQVVTTLKDDGKEATKRVVVKQFSSTAQPFVAKMIAAGMGKISPESEEFAKNFLDSPLGKSFMQMALGIGVQFLPDRETGLAESIGTEFRVQAMEGAGNVVLEQFKGELSPLTSAWEKLLDMHSKVRVTSEPKSEVEEDEHDHEQTTPSPAKKRATSR